MRSTPLLTQIFFLFYVLPFDGHHFDALTTGVLALASTTAPISPRSIAPASRASAASGRRRPRSISRPDLAAVILPQAIPPVVPALGNYLIGMFKETPFLATITRAWSSCSHRAHRRRYVPLH